MIEKRPFGRTGHLSTVTLFGAAVLSRATQAEASQWSGREDGGNGAQRSDCAARKPLCAEAIPTSDCGLRLDCHHCFIVAFPPQSAIGNPVTVPPPPARPRRPAPASPFRQ